MTNGESERVQTALKEQIALYKGKIAALEASEPIDWDDYERQQHEEDLARWRQLKASQRFKAIQRFRVVLEAHRAILILEAHRAILILVSVLFLGATLLHVAC